MARLSGDERRRRGRAKIPQTVRVRPSQPHGNDFDEVLPTLNVSRDGLYFASQRDTYYKDMRLFVIFPYSTSLGAINQEFIAKVVRIDQLADGTRGIAVQLLMPIHLGTHETIRRDTG